MYANITNNINKQKETNPSEISLRHNMAKNLYICKHKIETLLTLADFNTTQYSKDDLFTYGEIIRKLTQKMNLCTKHSNFLVLYEQHNTLVNIIQSLNL